MTARVFLLAVLCACFLAACGGSGADEESEPVRFLVFGEPEELKAYRTLVAAYEKRGSGEVELIEASDRSDLIARLSTSISGGNPPDLFLMNYRFYGQFASKGAIEPLEERLAASDALRADDFYPEALDAFRWQGEQLCLPQNISSLVVYYNRTLFQRYRMPEPKDDWRWGDLVATADPRSPSTRAAPRSRGDPDSGGAGGVLRARDRADDDPRGAVPLVERRRASWTIPSARRGSRSTLPKAWASSRRTFSTAAAARRHPLRHRGRGRGRRVALRERAARDAALLAPLDADLPHDRGLRLGYRAAPALRQACGDPPLRRVLPDQRLEAAGRSVAVRRVRARDGRPEDRLQDGQDRAVADRGLPLEGVPRSDAAAQAGQVFLDAIPTIRRVPTISTWPEIEDAAEGVLENGLYRGQRPADVARELDRVTRPLFARGEHG